MATPEEIERRIKANDSPKTVKRSAAAKRIGELAHRRATVAEQLGDVERELGDVLAESSDLIGTDELAKFTDIPIADLDRWLNDRKPKRTNRKRSAPAAKADTGQDRPAATTATSGRTPAPAASQPVLADASARVPEK